MDKKMQIRLWYIGLAIVGVFLLQMVLAQCLRVEPIPYSQFQTYLKNGQVDDIVVTQDYIRGKLKNVPNAPSEFETTRVDPNIATELEKYGVKFAGGTESTWLRRRY